ncbi:MAG: acetyltransferase family protein [Actinomycetia bacterium]|nr:acetyltransferase family protein [Actinomycetes bacterium]
MVVGVTFAGQDLGSIAAAGSAVAVDDPRKPDVTALLERHLTFSTSETPPEHSFALDVAGLIHPAITFFSYRAADGQLLGVGALKLLDGESGEVKSMHTAAEARGRGVGRAVLVHIIGAAREHGLRRIYLETGTTPGFAAARALYASEGFIACGTFGGYPITDDNTFMTLALT